MQRLSALPAFGAKTPAALLLLFTAGLLIRLPFLAQDFQVTADLPLLRAWAALAADGEWLTIYDSDERRYPPVAMAVLGAAGWLARGLPAGWFSEEAGLNLIIKSLATLGDAGIALLVYGMLRPQPWALAAAALWLLNPAPWYVSAIWGQLDSLFILLALGATVVLWRGAAVSGWLLYALALATKVQSLVFLPLIVGLSLRRAGWRSLGLGVTAAAGLLALVSLPWLAGGRLPALLQNVVGSSGRLVQDAYNFWYAVLGGGAFKALVSDRPNLWLNYQALAFGLTAGASLLALAATLRRTDGQPALGAALLAFAAFLFWPDARERYLLPALPFVLLAAGGWPRRGPSRRLAVAYLLVSLTCAFNLVTTASFAPELWTNLAAARSPHTDLVASLLGLARASALANVGLWLGLLLIAWRPGGADLQAPRPALY
ncbi:MAG: hypothetical protein ACRDHL_08380 [Candidatus Promineifilaceae bacterium]